MSEKIFLTSVDWAEIDRRLSDDPDGLMRELSAPMVLMEPPGVNEEMLAVLEAFERIKDLWLPAEVEEQHAEELFVLHQARNNMLAVIARARGEA